MRAHARSGLIGCIFAAWLIPGLMIVWPGVALTGTTSNTESPSIQGQHQGDDGSPRISVIDSPTPSCYYSSAVYDRCYITWRYLSVSAGPGLNMLRLTIRIDNRIRAVHSGFFQSSMYVPYNMYGDGFAVSCGNLGAGGHPDFGNGYSYVISAEDTGGGTTTNYGFVRCPASPPEELFFDRFELSLLGAW